MLARHHCFRRAISLRLFSGTAPRVPDRVTLDWLLAHQSQTRAVDGSLVPVRVLDGTWLMKESAHARFAASRIPGAVFFDLDSCVGDGGVHSLPHMLPTEAAFARHAGGRLGLKTDTPIVVYDSENSAFSAPRIWFTLKALGATNVGILEGGLNEYVKRGLPTHGAADPVATPAPAEFKAKLDASLVRTWQDVLANIETKACTVVDARNAGRFAGTAAEPRPHLIGGHIPGSLNIPSDLLLDTKTGLFKSDAQLRQVFAAAGVDVGPGCKPVIASCGSGVTACVLLYGLHLLGMRRYHLYDGSWSEWYGDCIECTMRDAPDLLISMHTFIFLSHGHRGIPALKLPIQSNKKA